MKFVGRGLIVSDRPKSGPNADEIVTRITMANFRQFICYSVTNYSEKCKANPSLSQTDAMAC